MTPSLLRTVYDIKPTFTIYQANGKRKEGLKKAFVIVRDIKRTDETITLPDGSIWPLYIEPSELDSFVQSRLYKHIISFQVYDSGHYFAVARLHVDKNQ